MDTTLSHLQRIRKLEPLLPTLSPPSTSFVAMHLPQLTRRNTLVAIQLSQFIGCNAFVAIHWLQCICRNSAVAMIASQFSCRVFGKSHTSTHTSLVSHCSHAGEPPQPPPTVDAPPAHLQIRGSQELLAEQRLIAMGILEPPTQT